MKPRLLITTSTFPNHELDPEPRFVLDLAAALSRHFEVTVLAPLNPGAARADAIGAVEVQRYAYAPLPSMGTLTYPGPILDRLKANRLRWGLVPLLLANLHRRVGQLLDERDFACVHAHWLVPQGWVQSRLAGRRAAVPYIAVAHGSEVHTLRGRIADAMVRATLSHASGLVSVSNFIEARLQERFPAEMDGLPKLVQGSAVNSELFTSSNRPGATASPSGRSGPVILCAGHMNEQKGFDVAIRAMAKEPLASSSASLAVFGRGSSKQRLEDLTSELGLQMRVRIHPAVDHKTLARSMADAALVCVPSLKSTHGGGEGLPSTLLEAAASGVPVVASDVGGIAEFVEDGVNGLLVPAGDATALGRAIHSVLSDPNTLSSMGEANRQRAQAMSWSRAADRYAELTRQVIERPR